MCPFKKDNSNFSCEKGSYEDAIFNKNLIKYIINGCDYDFDYLIQWQTPEFWDEKLWSCTFCVCELMRHFISQSNLNISESDIDRLEAEYIESLENI
jgi:hypothetical protein